VEKPRGKLEPPAPKGRPIWEKGPPSEPSAKKTGHRAAGLERPETREWVGKKRKTQGKKKNAPAPGGKKKAPQRAVHEPETNPQCRGGRRKKKKDGVTPHRKTSTKQRKKNVLRGGGGNNRTEKKGRDPPGEKSVLPSEKMRIKG